MTKIIISDEAKKLIDRGHIYVVTSLKGEKVAISQKEFLQNCFPSAGGGGGVKDFLNKR